MAPNLTAKQLNKVLILVGIILAVAIFLAAGFYFFVPQATAPTATPSPTPFLAQKLKNPPEIVKAVYVTVYSAGSQKYLNYLFQLFKNTEINAAVVDIKGSDGKLLTSQIADIDRFVDFFHKQNVYVIGRIAVFEDPQFAKARPDLAIYDKSQTVEKVLWKDRNGLNWMDPLSKEVWDYNLSLAQYASFHGFDEINFDYVRFPTDGKTDNIGYPFYTPEKTKSQVIKEFFQYLRAKLPDDKISADLFGLVTVYPDDMGIGQVLEDAFASFDYICPMVYPSHYANGFKGFENPAEHPYQVIKYSLDSAVNRKLIFSSDDIGIKTAKIRPWLQDFNMGADYTPEMVAQEIQAAKDSLGNDYAGFLLWNPSNVYNAY